MSQPVAKPAPSRHPNARRRMPRKTRAVPCPFLEILPLSRTPARGAASESYGVISRWTWLVSLHRCFMERRDVLDLGKCGQLERVPRVRAIRPAWTSEKSVESGIGQPASMGNRGDGCRKVTHHSPCTVLANIPAPSCGIGSTSTRRELRTTREKAPWCVGKKADTARVNSPSERSTPIRQVGT